jgi:hypothetical protein
MAQDLARSVEVLATAIEISPNDQLNQEVPTGSWRRSMHRWPSCDVALKAQLIL